MQHKKLIQSELNFNRTFRYITQAYQEIAVLKMRKVRTSVLATRQYLSRLSEVFYEIKKAKEKQDKLIEKQNKNLIEVLKKKKLRDMIDYNKDLNENLTLAKISTQPQLPASKIVKRDKTVSVLLSANTTLYGDLIKRIFDLFAKNVKSDGSDIIIVGRVGQRMYDEQHIKRPYIYFELPDVEIHLEELKPVIFHLVKYQKIKVYYGKFESIVNQSEVVSDVSGDNPFIFSPDAYPKQDKQTKVEVGADYLFEPDLAEILAFFEDLIASSLFRQTVHETQLARWASRILSMEKAQANVDLAIKKLKFSRSKLQKLDENRKQLDRLAGLTLWRR